MRCAWLMLPSKKAMSASGMVGRVAALGNRRVVTRGAPAWSHEITPASGGASGPERRIVLEP